MRGDRQNHRQWEAAFIRQLHTESASSKPMSHSAITKLRGSSSLYANYICVRITLKQLFDIIKFTVT